MPRQNSSQNPSRDPSQPTAFEDCRMSPEGVVSVVAYFRSQPLLRFVAESRLQAMAIAYLAHGGTDDNDHAVTSTGLHRVHHESHLRDLNYNWRDNLRPAYRRAVMDILTWWDRMSGGGTLLLHTPGTRIPSSPPSPEEVKLDVFLPIQAARSSTAVGVAAARIIQHFVEHIAVPIMHNWDRAKGLHPGGQLYNQSTPRIPSNRNVDQPLIPRLITPYVTFYGRAPGTLEDLISLELGDVGEPIIPSSPSATSMRLPDPPAASNHGLPNPPPPALGGVRSGGSHAVSSSAQPDDPSNDLVQVPPSISRVSGPRRSPREQDMAMLELQAQILELENIITTQGEEIVGLRNVLDSVDDAQVQSASGKGKGVASREQSPSLTSVSSIQSPSSSPCPSPVSRPSTPPASRTLGTSVRFASPQARPSGSRASPQSPSGAPSTYNYGQFTDHIVNYYELSRDTYRWLRIIQLKFAVGSWSEAIANRVPGVTKDIANELSIAMRKDWGLLPGHV